MKRLWISSIEDEAIRNGFASLKGGAEYKAIYAFALCKAKADWIDVDAVRISIHTPLAGCDHLPHQRVLRMYISIHGAVK